MEDPGRGVINTISLPFGRGLFQSYLPATAFAGKFYGIRPIGGH